MKNDIKSFSTGATNIIKLPVYIINDRFLVSKSRNYSGQILYITQAVKSDHLRGGSEG